MSQCGKEKTWSRESRPAFRFGGNTSDTRFADKVLMPGFVEGHCHAPEGQFGTILT
ncbi:MAG: hypothetical protein CM1200mP28_00520 [Deltaproteobacteria bacterium]|nr:MAG: hypothetical protein CM1200mP28_00520 [Deltaproteobacteria bacterium]